MYENNDRFVLPIIGGILGYGFGRRRPYYGRRPSCYPYCPYYYPYYRPYPRRPYYPYYNRPYNNYSNYN